MQNTGKWVFIFLLAMLLLCSCSRDKEKPAAKTSEQQVNRSHAVALIGDSDLSSEELKAYVKARSHRSVTSQVFDQSLDELVVAELLYREAIRLGIDQKPEVRQAMRQLLGHQLLEDMVNEPVMTRKIFEGELRQYYDDHQELYARPEQIRLADIFIAVPAGSDQADIDKKRAKANDILVLAQSVDHERFGFSRLVKEHSDQHPLYRFGDTGFFDRSGLPDGVAMELVDAGFSLPDSGALADQVVQTSDGFHIIKLITRRKAFSRDFDSVAKDIEQRIRKEELSEKRAALIASLKKQGNVKIQQDVLERIREELLNDRRQYAGNAENAGRAKPVLPAQLQ